MATTLADLRRYAVDRSLFPPTTLERALDTLGFVQADPIRAPARAQDLTLRHRVDGLSRRRSRAALRSARRRGGLLRQLRLRDARRLRLMHPRGGRGVVVRRRGERRVEALLEFRARSAAAVHPREVDEHFAHGTVTNYWGGSSSATTHLLDGDALSRPAARRAARGRHPRVRRRAIRLQPPADDAAPRARLDALVDVIVRKYAPLPASSLSNLVRRLRYAVPQWERALTRRAAAREVAAGARARRRRRVVLAGRRDASEQHETDAEMVRLLAPFDPVVWDRRRFELLWGWAYRFEAYTPVKKREPRLLRAAAAVARPGDRLGQHLGEERRAGGRLRLRRCRAAPPRVHARARRRARADANVPRTLVRRPEPDRDRSTRGSARRARSGARDGSARGSSPARRPSRS